MLRLLAVVILVGMGSLFGLNKLEQASLYPFDRTEVSPADAGVPRARAERFKNDEESLVLWTALPRKGKPVIVYFHGNAGNLASRAGRFNRFLDRGYGLAAMAYRGSSGSTGTPSEKALTWDAERLFLLLGNILPPDTPRVLYGESLGTGVAIALLSTPAVTEAKGFGSPAAVILEAPYTSISDIAIALDARNKSLLPFLKSKWESLSRASGLTSPLLVLHGSKDELIPIEQGRQIYFAAPSQHKQFVEVTTAGHNDLWRTDTLPKLWSFVDRHTGTR